MNDPIEMIISYEDRLRLSELAGKLADAQWMVDNPLIANILPCILVFILGLALAGILFLVLDEYLYRVGARAWKLICCVLCLVPFIITVMAFLIAQEYRIHDVGVIQAEIDEIRNLWGLKEAII